MQIRPSCLRSTGLLLCALLLWSGCDTTDPLDESGELIIEDLAVGEGPEAAAGTRIMIHSKGMLENGDVFDTSHDEVHPYIFTLGANQVIDGWEQGIPGMKPGGKRRLTVPPRLAFGNSSGGAVPPNSTVIFEIELFKVDHPDSLGIEELRAGDGAEVTEGSEVTVHYRGTFGNAQQFDSSYDRNEPMTFTLGEDNIIPGFVQGILGMKEGARRRLVIPPRLAYGSTGTNGIPPNATLVFEIEVLDVAE